MREPMSLRSSQIEPTPNCPGQQDEQGGPIHRRKVCLVCRVLGLQSLLVVAVDAVVCRVLGAICPSDPTTSSLVQPRHRPQARQGRQ